MALTLSIFCGRHNRIAVVVCVGVLAILIFTGHLPARLLLFTMGFAVFRKEVWFGRAHEAAALVIVAGGIMIGAGAATEAICGMAAAGALIGGAQVRFPPLAARVIAASGAISYSLYLVHVPVGGRDVNLGRRIVETPSQAFAPSFLALLISLLPAWALWQVVELPSIRASRRWRAPHGSSDARAS